MVYTHAHEHGTHHGVVRGFIIRSETPTCPGKLPRGPYRLRLVPGLPLGAPPLLLRRQPRRRGHLVDPRHLLIVLLQRLRTLPLRLALQEIGSTGKVN